jgi:hypothetical protein
MKNYYLKNLIIILSFYSCRICDINQATKGQINYFDKTYTFKSEFQFSVSEDGSTFKFKNISSKPIYMATVLTPFESDDFIELYNDVDLTFKVPITISLIENDSLLNFNCKECIVNTNKPLSINLFWVYDFKEFSQHFRKLKKIDATHYNIEPVEYKKVKGMSFIEIDKIIFCDKLKYKIRYEKY